MLTDTHAHLDFPDFAEDLDGVIARAEAAGVRRIITIGTSIEGSRRAIELAERFPNVWAVVGVHPNAADEAPEDVLTPLRELASHPRVVAIGETGLDYYRLPSTQLHKAAVATSALGNVTPADIDVAIQDGAIKAIQARVFQQQLDLAVELGLNVVVHERASWADTVALLKPYTGKLRAVFHCFGGSPEQAAEIRALGHLVSFTGIVTFKNAPLAQESATVAPAGNFMVETDCPFLAPVPYRGKRCEPAYVRQTAEKIAALRGTTLESLAEETERTAESFYRFGR
ncbi:TatD family hydrolase [Verrucomicrobiota bacterium sgz303538]